MPKGNFALLSKWWSDTNQHRYGLAAYIRMRSQRGDTLDVLTDDINGRLDGDVEIHRATVARWINKLQDETPS